MNIKVIELKKKHFIKEYKAKKKINYELCFSDIETIIINNIHQAVVISILYQDKIKTFNIENDLNDYFDYIKKNLKNPIIYFHNFGRFDSVFILKNLVTEKNYKITKIIERNNIIYEIKINNIRFRDSRLMIPLSLKEIGNTFCEKNKKNEFNYGDITEIYKKNPELIIDQCENDCKVLQEGFLKFRSEIKSQFDIDIEEQLTIPSLSLKIFKKNYYDINNTPISINPYDFDEFIRESYFGGISEVYKPHLKDQGYCYDANSLYPFIMMKEKFPVGEPKFVSASEIDLNNFIGFIKCHVINENENNTLLPYRDPVRGLICPAGRWTGVYYHKEIKKAIELGYEIEMIKGVKYEKEDYIFSDFVSNLYELRMKNKNNLKGFICKLIMNSLYGRFGMKIFIERTKFITYKELVKMKENYLFVNFYPLLEADNPEDDLFVVTLRRNSQNNKENFALSVDTETAVQIASAITSCARLYMYSFKNIENNTCYYSDTDSIFLEKKLDEKHVGNELGKFKLEYEFKNGYFVAPKVYQIEFFNGERKTVFKGMKKEEFNKSIKNDTFEKIIYNNHKISIKRTSNFVVDLINLIVKKKDTEINFQFPFRKRNKIYDLKNKYWIDTSILWINKIKFK
jgi:hypothetical protein